MMREKRKIKIAGTLIYPLCIGRAAIIQEEKTVRITSSVQHFVTSPSGEVQIETLNTRYVLTPACNESRAGI